MVVEDHSNLRPITREVLRAFYAQCPLEPVPRDALQELQKQSTESTFALLLGNDCSTHAVWLDTQVMTRIDECLWRSRMFSEVSCVVGSFQAQCAATCTSTAHKYQAAHHRMRVHIN